MTSARDSAAALVLAALGALFLNVEPAIAGAVDRGFHLGTRTLGLVLSVESIGMLAGSVLAFAFLPKLGPRIAALAGLILYMLTNAVTIVAQTPAALGALRACCGIGEGIIVAIGFALMAGGRTPHRLFGGFGALQTGSAIGAFVLLTWMMHAYSWKAAFAVFALAGLASMLLLPADAQTESNRSPEGTSPIDVPGTFGLLSILIFFAAQTAIWPFLEHMGAQRGVGDFEIAGALSFGALCGLIGSIVVTALPSRFAGMGSWIVAGALNVLAIGVLAFSQSASAFVVALGLFNFAWAGFAPLQLSALRRLNVPPTAFALASTATTAGFAIGPVIGGYAIRGDDYAAALAVGALGTIVALALVPTARAFCMRRC